MRADDTLALIGLALFLAVAAVVFVLYSSIHAAEIAPPMPERNPLAVAPSLHP